MTQLCLTTYSFPSFTHTHNGDDTLPRLFLICLLSYRTALFALVVILVSVGMGGDREMGDPDVLIDALV